MMKNSSVAEACLPCTCFFLAAIRIPSKRCYYQRWIFSFSFWISQNHLELSQNISEISIKSHRIPEDPRESHKNPGSWGWVKIELFRQISVLVKKIFFWAAHPYQCVELSLKRSTYFPLTSSGYPPCLHHTRIPPPRLWDWQLAPVGGRRPLPTELHSILGRASCAILARRMLQNANILATNLLLFSNSLLRRCGLGSPTMDSDVTCRLCTGAIDFTLYLLFLYSLAP